ncbi:ABC transporter permease [Simiduia sp. 21SJ11W-1]|uniref:ABC transporter permease n=1 Tax=Simiduia sp. 21SJ11W-1 TaxID=2909669 RepID=UPI00209E7C67|nr:ABC transporter permease [Simiduia sp. 21SJ11W-1]UTA48895.1 ABC transporter permease [Simiduia sp. 21SJ11W-1]
MKRLLTLFIARNKEYYRDKSSLVWSFIMPPLIIGVVALAFGAGGQPLFKVGVLSGQTAEALFQPGLVHTVAINDADYGQTRVAHHQLDMLVSESHYWVNPTSQKGEVLEALLKKPLLRQEVTGRAVRYVDWVVPGILGMNLMFSALWGIGYVIVRYRKNGVLKRLQATPTRPIEFLGAQIASRMMIMLMVSSIVYISCDVFLDFLMLGSYWDLLVVAFVGNLSMLALGLVVAARVTSEEFANGLLNFISFPLLMVSEVWFSLDGAPAWLSQLSNLSPLTHMVKAARAIMVDGASLVQVADHLLILLGISAVLLALSTKLFRWQP